MVTRILYTHAAPPSPGLSSFIQKSLTSTNTSFSVVVVSLVLIARLRRRAGTVPGNGCGARIWVVAMMLSMKMLMDDAYTTQSWARASGLGLPEMLKAEQEFLDGIGWQALVEELEYTAWVEYLEAEIVRFERQHHHHEQGHVYLDAYTPGDVAMGHSYSLNLPFFLYFCIQSFFLKKSWLR